MEYIETPIKPVRVGRTLTKMSKSTNKTEAPAKVYNKTKGEHFKDMVIVALVIGIAAFIGGNVFAAKQSAEVRNAVSAATQSVAPVAEAAAPASK